MGSVSRLIRPVDVNTGEIIEGSFSITQTIRAPAALRKGGFVMLSQTQWVEALLKKDLRGNDLRVLLQLFTMIDYENWIHVDQGVIAEKVGMLPRNVNTAIKHLVDAGVLIRGPKVGRFGTLRMNPSIAWKGKSHGHSAAVLEFDKGRSGDAA